MKFFILLCFVITFSISSNVCAQYKSLTNGNWSAGFGKNGELDSLRFHNSGNTFLFNHEKLKGPSWYILLSNDTIEPTLVSNKDNKWIFNYENVDYTLEYQISKDNLVLIASVTNHNHAPYQPIKAGIRLGIDTYMDFYPVWETKVFPSLMRCEKTHFWGYFMSPLGKILTIASPDPIASWSHDYSIGYGKPPAIWWGHRIESVNLDLINATPLPYRHPQDLYQIMPNETKIFKIYLGEAKRLEELDTKISALTEAPYFELANTSCEKENNFTFSIISNKNVHVVVHTPDDKIITLNPNVTGNNRQQYIFKNTNTEGTYTIVAQNDNKISEAKFYVRRNYSWYMEKAIEAVTKYPQRASKSHCEAWYGFYTAFAGGKYFPDNEYVKKADNDFKKIFPIVFDTVKLEPFEHKSRIQNISSIIGILVDRYQLYSEENDLRMAIGFANLLLQAQSKDGAYRNGKTHYTSVIYIAKSLMELLKALEGKFAYHKSYDTIYKSVKMAMEELQKNKTDLETEGEQTFEDGMISCTALQLGEYGLMQKDEKERKKFADAAAFVLNQHKCLEQLVIPDCRMRGGSLRFWEAQYDVFMGNNFFNSPHGWSAWTTYATYYLYLLTGDVSYLTRTFNSLDAAMQTIDLKTGNLHWAFMVNPYVDVVQLKDNVRPGDIFNSPPGHVNSFINPHSKFVMGENYVDMVSNWFYGNANDNDAHEHFKCLEEVALGKAYLAETNTGQILSYNCKVLRSGNNIRVIPNEKIITKVHYNLKKSYKITIEGSSRIIKQQQFHGLGWISM